jgi:hypothetical protein
MTDDTESVRVDAETARVALYEIEQAIERTGGPGAVGSEACSPLALARRRVEACDDLDDDARDAVVGLLHDVADERGVEITDADPLVEATFQAQSDLTDVVEGGADGPEPTPRRLEARADGGTTLHPGVDVLGATIAAGFAAVALTLAVVFDPWAAPVAALPVAAFVGLYGSDRLTGTDPRAGGDA